MRSMKYAINAVGIVVLWFGLTGTAYGQDVYISVRPLASNVIVPQSRAFRIEASRVRPRPEFRPVEITEIEAEIRIIDQHATTTLDIRLRNPNNRREEAEMIVPVPDGAVVRGFTFQGSGREPSATVLPKDEARRIYDEIVARVRDPALLEFAGCNLIRSSVFPVEAHGTQQVRLVYEHLLTADGERVDYVLPRSESLEYSIPWRIKVAIQSKKPLNTVYSPSHPITTVRADRYNMTVQTAEQAGTTPGPFRLSYLLGNNGVTASLLAYPDPKVGGGYFLLLAGLPAPAENDTDGPAIKREITLVLDRSGSMHGEKIEQVREAALQVLAGLEEGEAFNIIIYNEAVDVFANEPVLKTDENIQKARAYIKSVNPQGGTNLHDALLEALRQKPRPEMLPIVLFLTDGLPTIGQTSEVAIRNLASEANPYNRRVFTFGVGVDVNVPLLDKIADLSRAKATFVLPKENVEVKVAQVFKQLAGPVLADPQLAITGEQNDPGPHRVRDMIPARLPDLFEGDQLVLLGQYLGDEPLGFRLSGNYLGRQRTFEFSFALDKATTRNSFVPRLWASRKIAVLVDAIRQLGANGNPLFATGPSVHDPKVKELIEEIVRLSTEFGILTEYTAFLAREGTDLSQRERLLSEASTKFQQRAMNTRSGLGGVNQAANNVFMKEQSVVNPSNNLFDENMNRVSVTEVQQINDRAFYRKNGRWIDSRIVNQSAEAPPSRVIEFGSDDFRQLAARLAAEGRPGMISLRGDILMVVDNESVLVKAPAGD